jgi:hypothetical protein
VEVFPGKSSVPPVDLIEVDLASLGSVRKAACDLLARAEPFDVLMEVVRARYFKP